MNIVEYTRKVLSPQHQFILSLVYGLPIEGPKLTIRPGWQNRAVEMDPATYAETLRDEGRAPSREAGAPHAVVLMGRRTGKNFLANVVASYEAAVPRDSGWGVSGTHPVYVVYANKDLADRGAAEFAKIHAELSGLQARSWDGRTLRDARERPVVSHLSVVDPADTAKVKGVLDGLVVWNDIGTYASPDLTWDLPAPRTRVIAFTQGDTGGFVKRVTQEMGSFNALRYQFPAWELLPSTNGFYLDAYKSMVERHPPHTPELNFKLQPN